MARIVGVDIPNDKPVRIALTYIYGIGRKIAQDICDEAGEGPRERHDRRLRREDQCKRDNGGRRGRGEGRQGTPR